MTSSPYKTPTGYLLPSVHSAPPFFTQQPNPSTQSRLTDYWINLILSYARFRKLFVIKVDDAVVSSGGDWDEVLRNDRINRRVKPEYLSYLLAELVDKNLAVYDPPKQTRSVLLYWRVPEEWAEVLYDWASSTGQINSILTYYEITEPAVLSPLSDIPVTLLKKAIGVLAKTGRAQVIGVSDGEGVRFLTGSR